MPLKKSDLMYDYPQELVATEPQRPPRVLYKEPHKPAQEISFENILEVFSPDDLLIINKTQVLPRRIFLPEFDILFLHSEDEKNWTTLFPAKKFKVGQQIELPEGVVLTLEAKGRPQKVQANQSLTLEYFNKHAGFALPPYIQQARGESKPRPQDWDWYQTSWAQDPGSLAAPTASLHFNNDDLQRFKNKIQIAEITLHVGLGTFLPIDSENLDEHKMHHEFVDISAEVLKKIKHAQEKKNRVWCLGTTSLRAIESYAQGLLQAKPNGGAEGSTDLFIKPGDDFKICGGLLTNFHQPGSTLICLVSALAGYEETMQSYKWAIEKKFKLFSYGDLSVWKK